MCKQIKVHTAWMFLTLTALVTYIPNAVAQGSYGATVDNACLEFNGTQPYEAYKLTAEGLADKCTFCHQPKSVQKKERKDPEWTWWQNQFTQMSNFCPPQTNQAPDGRITAPANNATFNIGSSVVFTSTATDPDDNTPLTYAWNFAGAAVNSTVQNPTIIVNTVGTFTVSLTVTDSLGRVDPTPAKVTIVVKDPNANQAPNGVINAPSSNTTITVGDTLNFSATATDPDNSNELFSYRWTFAGAGPDSFEQNPLMKFNTVGIYTVLFNVTDSKGLSDPTPASRTISVNSISSTACPDQDNDQFSGKGGICGPIDCNDFNAAINPGAIESCGDRIDNDCNGDIDRNDAHCSGADCIGDLLKQIDIASAAWDQEDRELKVKGFWPTAGALVTLSDPITGAVLGTTVVKGDDDDDDDDDDEDEDEDDRDRRKKNERDEEEDSDSDDDDDDDDHGSNENEWKFELEDLLVAPCRVRVEIDGRFGERDVTYAPANCSGKPPVSNTSPIANDDSASTTTQVPVEISVLANDTDADKDALTIIVFTQPKHGVVTRKDEVLTYKSKRRFKGMDQFSYTVSDRHGGTDKVKVSVTVKAKSNLITVKIAEAKWKRKDHKLSVKGADAPKNASVKLFNATTKVMIGETKANKKGKWQLKLKQLSDAPCKVAVEITDKGKTGYAEKAVKKAPKRCR